MGIVNKLGRVVRERRRAMAAALAVVGVTAGVFFVGAWAGSSGAVTLGPVAVAAPHAPNAPSPNGSEHDGGGSHKSGPGMSHHKMSPGMPMDKQMPDKRCCDK